MDRTNSCPMPRSSTHRIHHRRYFSVLRSPSHVAVRFRLPLSCTTINRTPDGREAPPASRSFARRRQGVAQGPGGDERELSRYGPYNGMAGMRANATWREPLSPLAFRSQRYDTGAVNGTDFVRRARRYARRAGKSFHFDPRRGKGSHGVLSVGDRRTVVKRGELKPGALQGMLKQLDIPREDF